MTLPTCAGLRYHHNAGGLSSSSIVEYMDIRDYTICRAYLFIGSCLGRQMATLQEMLGGLPVNRIDAIRRKALGQFGEALHVNYLMLQFLQARNKIKMLDKVTGFKDGLIAGLRGEERDWKRLDCWHRGYLRGRLQRFKETGKMWI